jgi:hypothetical protein
MGIGEPNISRGFVKCFCVLQTDKLSYEQMQNYHISVTERECNEGIVNMDFTKYTAMAFLRKIEDINMADTRGGNHQTFKGT